MRTILGLAAGWATAATATAAGFAMLFRGAELGEQRQLAVLTGRIPAPRRSQPSVIDLQDAPSAVPG